MTHRVSRATLTSQIEDALRLDIIEGVLAPGQRLPSAGLTERYEVSATPLREALQRLSAQNLVEIDPRFGATVARISLADLRDTYWLREVLERRAVERSIERGDDAWRERVTQAFEAFRKAARPSPEETTEGALSWSRVHREFHEALFAACDSDWLRRMLATLYDHSERYRMLSRRTGARDTMHEHAAVFNAAMEGRIADAAEALGSHLQGTVTLLESTIPAFDGPEAPAQPATDIGS